MHDLVLDVEIGVYTHEKGVDPARALLGRCRCDRRPRPRSTTISAAPSTTTPSSRASRTIVARGHINLVETLAEDVAMPLPRPSARSAGHRQNREARQGAGRRRRRDRARQGKGLTMRGPPCARSCRTCARSRPTRGPIVVKLGGSVVRSAELPAWLDAIAAAPTPDRRGAGRRGARRRGARLPEPSSASAIAQPTAWRCSPWISSPGPWRACGRASPSARPRPSCAPRSSAASVAVWAPYALIAERTDIEESWRLTSDSLALWLARRLGAARCYLIKSIARKRRRSRAPRSSRATASSMRPFRAC